MDTDTPTDDDIAALAMAFLTPRRDAEAARPLHLPGARALRFATSQGEVAAVHAGSGAPVLLVHGWEGQASDLEAIARRLLAQGRSVLAIDLPAHGASQGRWTSIPHSARALVELQQQFGPVSAVVAHSVGCAVAVEAMLAGMAVRAAALLAAPARYIDYARGFAQLLRLSEAQTQALLAALLRLGVDVRSVAMPPRVGRLDVPALFVHAEDDRVVPIADAQASSSAWPGARLLRLQGLGHRRLLSDAAVVDAVAAFIEHELSLAETA